MLSKEITYEDWLEYELKSSCDSLEIKLRTLKEVSRLDESEYTKQTLLGELFQLRGFDNEFLVEFEKRIMDEFKSDYIQNVDTGLVIPHVPHSCFVQTSEMQNALDDLKAYKKELQNCLNMESWLNDQLVEACKVPAAEAEELIKKYDIVRVEAAKAEQITKLNDLIVFKGLY